MIYRYSGTEHKRFLIHIIYFSHYNNNNDDDDDDDDDDNNNCTWLQVWFLLLSHKYCGAKLRSAFNIKIKILNILRCFEFWTSCNLY